MCKRCKNYYLTSNILLLISVSGAKLILHFHKDVFKFQAIMWQSQLECLLSKNEVVDSRRTVGKRIFHFVILNSFVCLTA